jgi:uncharacterized protein (DUF2267 family)
MAHTIGAFEASRQKTNLWLKEICDELRTNSRRQAYAALRAVLHTVRDCLPVEETAKFAGQLPLIVKGLLYDGWHPHEKPARLTKAAFYERVEKRLHGAGLSAAQASRAVLLVLEARLSTGEIEALKRVLPHEVRDLWSGVEEEGSGAVRTRASRDTAQAAGYERRTPVWP